MERLREEFYKTETSESPKRMLVYLPPGYSGERLPVLYLTHGISQTEEHWETLCGASRILDEGIASGGVKPCIAVMVNGRACEGGAIPGEKYGIENIRVFMDFEDELISRIIPEIDLRYNTIADRSCRAITGFSMGGYQSVNFGLSHLDKFAYIGGFSPAPAVDAKGCLKRFLKSNKNADLKELIKLFYVSSGTLESGGEGIFGEFKKYAERTHAYMSSLDLNCVYDIFEGGHEPAVWSLSLESFIRRLWI